MIMSWLVFGMCLIIAALLIVCMTKLDEIERHDEAVRMRWANAHESEPPEWADPEKWWESEGRE